MRRGILAQQECSDANLIQVLATVQNTPVVCAKPAISMPFLPIQASLH
jgi:hypothetical protein